MNILSKLCDFHPSLHPPPSFLSVHLSLAPRHIVPSSAPAGSWWFLAQGAVAPCWGDAELLLPGRIHPIRVSPEELHRLWRVDRNHSSLWQPWWGWRTLQTLLIIKIKQNNNFFNISFYFLLYHISLIHFLFCCPCSWRLWWPKNPTRGPEVSRPVLQGREGDLLVSGWSGSARVSWKGLHVEQGVEWFNTTVPRCRIKGVVFIRIQKLHCYRFRGTEGSFFKTKLGIKAVPEQFSQ